MKNQASETTRRRTCDMVGIISLAKMVGESAFAFPPSAAEKSEQRRSLLRLSSHLALQQLSRESL